MIGGIVLSLAGSPPVAERLGSTASTSCNRHLFFFLPALGVMLGDLVPVAPPGPAHGARGRLHLAVAAARGRSSSAPRTRARRRWINIAGVSIQPSEFMKPAFVVICAWLFAENSRRGRHPRQRLRADPPRHRRGAARRAARLRQTMLVAAVWGALFFMAGMPWLGSRRSAASPSAASSAPTRCFPHVAGRINRFLAPHTGDTFQVDTAIGSFMNGGWLGRGPGEGTVKRILPDAHTDFIFAVAAEEFGIISASGSRPRSSPSSCIRGLRHAEREPRPLRAARRVRPGRPVRRAGGDQHGVNLHLMPAKGMTLPFISYGGSSMIAWPRHGLIVWR
jgi:cell division protein FtsW